jgi:signal transduction histidine kinase/ligand-binding sensor protein
MVQDTGHQQFTEKSDTILFADLFDLDKIQRLQDLFAETHGVASVITNADGVPITRPSNFTRLCIDIIRNTAKGCINCFKSDAMIGRHNPDGPIVQPCLSGGLWDAGASITVGGMHVANWLIGQVRNDNVDQLHMMDYANEIGANYADFIAALNEVPEMSVEQFKKISDLLFVFANELSESAYASFLLKKEVAERKQAEKKLIEIKEQYDNLVANIPVGVYILKSKPDGSFALEFASSKMAEMTGMSVDQLFNLSNAIPKAIHPDDYEMFMNMVAEGIQLAKPFDWKGRVLIEGKEKWYHVSSLPQPLGDGDVLWHGLIVDITERVEYEVEIKLKNEELHNIVAEKDKFYSIIAHDLRSPFNSFLGYTELMVEELDNMSLKQIQAIAVDMKKTAKNLYNLLENLLQWARIQQGNFGFEPEIFLLKPKIEESINLIIELANKKEVEIINLIPDKLPVYADSNMLKSITRNLVANAVKFTSKRGTITINARKHENNGVEISVADTGIGINQKMLGKLFRIDEKISRKGTEGEPSTGLGLIICKDFVEKHGGNIWVESEEGKGSTFFFTINSQDPNH